MLVEGVMNLIYKFFSSVLANVNIAATPSELTSSMQDFLSYINSGASLFKLFIPINLTAFFVVFFLIFAFEHLYPFIMWILRKIPFLGIE